MPKRRAHDISYYQNKIRKLEETEKQRRRIRILDSSSEDENVTVPPNHEIEPIPGPSKENSQVETDICTHVADVTIPPDIAIVQRLPDSEPEPPTSVTEAQVSLDPELLSALGIGTCQIPDFGPYIHDSLANLWMPIFKKGIAKEEKESLTKEYLIPGNCKLMQAPTLNAEISAAVSDTARVRDKKYISFQQQLGSGTAAINRAMDVLLTSENKAMALKYLSDGCRILSDLHYCLSMTRTKLITPGLDKNFLHVISDAERDDTLFGSGLSEKIKASKAIEKQGSQIQRKLTYNIKGISQNTFHRLPGPGNWHGPPRYPASRGGRGGPKRAPPPPPPRRHGYYQAARPSARTSTFPRPRAPHH